LANSTNIYLTVLKLLEKSLETIVATLVVAIVLIISMQVFYRYIIQEPIAWSEEFVTLCYQWLSLLGAALAVRHRAHFGVDIAIRFIGPNSKQRLLALNHIVIWILGFFMLFYGIKVVINSWSQMYPTLPWSYGVGYSVVPLAGFLFLFMDLIVLKENYLKTNHKNLSTDL